MKSVISTLHFYNNFGSVLQAFALKRTVDLLTGGQTDILPYRPNLPEYRYFKEEELQKKNAVKCQKFEAFRKNVLGMEEGVDRRLTEPSDISRYYGSYDAYIVGSDIVWGKEFSDLSSVYFLEHAEKGSKRTSYAASMIAGDIACNEEGKRRFAENLNNFTAISVRESSSVKIVEDVLAQFGDRSNKCVEAVLDPTLLLDREDYDELIRSAEEQKEGSSEYSLCRKDSKPYLFSYFLTHDPAVVDYTNMIARKLNLRVIHYFADYPDRVFDKDAECFAFAGPEEFLSLVKNAACVFTNSFHGTCFSMIYRKPFYTYTAERAMLSRVKDTCVRLGMEDRYFTDFRDLEKVTLDIDYTEFEKKLELERRKSLDFLKKSLME